MRTLRVWLLVLMAVLLPFRAALASAMPCATWPSNATHAQGVQHHQHHQDHQHDQHDQHLADAQHASDDGAPHHGLGDAGKCASCCTVCSAPALPGTAPVLAQAPGGAAVFQVPWMPPLSFVSGGQDRPPRTI
ncbi:MAG: hypothetical protein ACXWC6_01195 [Ramlibacter sp.]